MTGPGDHLRDTGPAAQAADPSTPLATLQQLAQHHPELRATIAENPSAYPALLEWLGRLGHPDVDAALARRAAREAGPAPGAERPVERRSILGRDTGASAGTPAAAWSHSEPTQPLWQQSAPASPAADPDPGPGTAVFGAAAAPQPGPSPGEPFQGGPSQSGPFQPGPFQGAPPAGPPLGAPDAVAAEEPKRRTWIPLVLLAVLATAMVVLVILLLRQGDEEAAAPPTEPAATQTEEPPAEEEEDEEETTEDADLEGARQELALLPQATSCSDPDADAGAFGEFASVAAPEGSWTQAEDADLVIATLEDLQEACGNIYAVEVAQALSDGEGTPEALATTIADAGTGWVDLARPAPEGAAEMSAFTAPSRNIFCTLGEDVARCRIVEHDFAAPEGCHDGTTLEVTAEGSTSRACDEPVGSQDTDLGYGDSAVSGFFACTSEETGMTCWNTLTGDGFSMARAGYETF